MSITITIINKGLSNPIKIQIPKAMTNDVNSTIN